VLEIGGDYYTGSGRRYDNRLYWVVAKISEYEMSYWKFDTMAQAIKGARLLREAHAEIVISDFAQAA
jgi:hypothetical protein